MIIIMIILLYSFFFGDGVAGAKVGGFVAVQTWRNRSNSHRCLSCDGGLELGVNNEPEDEGVVGVLFENDTCGISFARVAFPPAKITNRFHYNQLDHLSPPFSGELGGCDTTEAAFITPACDRYARGAGVLVANVHAYAPQHARQPRSHPLGAARHAAPLRNTVVSSARSIIKQ